MSMNDSHGAIPVFTGNTPPDFGQFRKGVPVALDDKMRPDPTVDQHGLVEGLVVGLFGPESRLLTLADVDGVEHTVRHSYICPRPDGWPEDYVWQIRYCAAQRAAGASTLFGGNGTDAPLPLPPPA